MPQDSRKKQPGASPRSGPIDRKPASRRPPPRPSPDRWSQSSCSCASCQQACLNTPGWFLPNQLGPLADFLKLDLDTVFRKYLAVGTTSMPNRSLAMGVMPHKFQDFKKPGCVWTLHEIAKPGRCIFLDRGRCTIYPVRPFECSCMIHSRKGQAIKLRQHVALAWTKNLIKRYLDLARLGIT